MLDTIIHFFTHPIFIIISGISTIVVIISFIFFIYSYSKGIIRVLYRVGFGIASKKIAIIAPRSEFEDIKEILIDSKLFKDTNIIQIDENKIEKALNANIFIFYWDECSTFFSDIVAKKSENTSLIVYAPPHCKEIDNENMNKINKTMNATLVRFRGRLLCDIFFSLIITKSEKKE